MTILLPSLLWGLSVLCVLCVTSFFSIQLLTFNCRLPHPFLVP